MLSLAYVIFSLLRPAYKPTYLLDFYCLRPPDRYSGSSQYSTSHAKISPDSICPTFLDDRNLHCSVKVVNSSSNCKSKCEGAHWMHAGWKCHGQRWLPEPVAQSTAAASFSLTFLKKCWRSQAWATGHTCLSVRAKLPALTKSVCLQPFFRTHRPSNA